MLQCHIEADLFPQRAKRMFFHMLHGRNRLQDKTSELRYDDTVMHQKQTFNMCYDSKHTTKINLLSGLPKKIIIFPTRTASNSNLFTTKSVFDDVKNIFVVVKDIFDVAENIHDNDKNNLHAGKITATCSSDYDFTPINHQEYKQWIPVMELYFYLCSYYVLLASSIILYGKGHPVLRRMAGRPPVR